MVSSFYIRSVLKIVDVKLDFFNRNFFYNKMIKGRSVCLDTAKKPLQTGYQHFKTLKNGQGIAPGGSNFEKIFLNCCANQLSTQIFQYTSPEIKNKALNQPVFVSSDP